MMEWEATQRKRMLQKVDESLLMPALQALLEYAQI